MHSCLRFHVSVHLDILLQAQGPQFLSDIIQPAAPFQTASYVLCKLTQFCNPYIEMEFSVLA